MKPAVRIVSALALLLAPVAVAPLGSGATALAQPAPPRAPRKPAPRAQPDASPAAKPGAKPAGDDKTPRKPTLPRKPLLLPKLGASKGGKEKPGQADPAPAPGAAPGAGDSRRWTGTTPEETLDLALARARGAGDDAIGGLLVAAAMHADVGADRVPRGLAEIGRTSSPIAEDARWLARMLGARAGAKPWPGLAAAVADAGPDRDGLIENLAIVGPFQDTGGGLARREGPEATGQRWADPSADYSWGAYEVRWRRALPGTVSARGLPLDLYVSPRNETCSYLASKVEVPATHQGPVHVHVASSGAIRLVWDGTTLGSSEEQHASMVLDRMQRAIDGVTPGAHLLALKVCTSSAADAGRVRLRLSDGSGKPLAFRTSSDLSGAEPTARRPEPASKAAVGAASRRVPTNLEQAAGHEGKSIDQALLAALARTFGGADNAQSPRAPGLLDRVARAPATSADQLAMAGWLSPFGSNKSGWLNLARARAHAEGDRAAESFAQRALIASSLSGSMGDWAVAASREEPLASARDASARHLRALVTMRSGGTGTIQSALEQLLAIERDERGKAGLAVWRDIQRTARGDSDLALRAARRLVALGQSRDPSYVRAHLPEGAELVERVVASSLLEQRSSGDLVQLGRELARLGRHAWAREVFEVAVRVAPNDADAWAGLAESLARASATGAGPGESPPGVAPSEGAASLAQRSRAALRRVLALRPGDARAKAELAAREGEATEGGLTGERDERWIAPPASFLARAKASPAKKGEVFSRQLHWVRAVTLHPDARVSQLIQYAREIVVEPRTQAELFERDIPEEGDEAELLIARVHRKDGTIVEPEERGSGSRAYVRWPELHAGDVVEVALRTWTGPIGRRGDPPFYFIDYVGSNDANPVLYNEVVVDSPASAPLAVEVLNGRADRATDEREGDRLVQRFVWDAPPALPDEPLGPRLGDALPLVVGSSYRSWDEFLTWYRGAVQGFTEPDDQVRRIAADLVKGKRTREEKVEALFDFVADDIRYVNYVSGEWWLPNRPQQLLARRQGDCDDKAMLLVSLLRSVGIEATPVLVQTRYTAMPSVLSGSKAAIPLFDHGIAFLPGEGGRPGTWLDATSPQSRIGTLPSMDARARALMVERGPAKIIETPPSSPTDHGVFAEWKVTLEASGAASLVATEKHRGDSAFELRTVLSEADARGQWVERYLQSRLPTVEVDPAVSFDPKAGLLTYKAKSAGLGRREGEEIAVPLAGTRTYTSAFAPLPASRRTLPVVLPPGFAPSEQRYRSTLVAPKGWRFAALPPGGKVDGGALGRGALTIEAGAQPNTVVVDLTVTLDQSTIPLADYAAFRGMLQRIDALTHRVVRLVPDVPAAPATPKR